MKRIVKKDSTSKIFHIFIQDSSQTDGSGLTGLVYNTASLTAYYIREGAALAVQITLATATVGTYTSGGFKEVDATNMPGVYDFHPPNACFVTGSDAVVIMLKGASDMAPVLLEIQLVSYDPNDVVRLGLTALPNAVAEGAGGLYTRGSGAGQIKQDTNGQVDVDVQKWLGTTVATPSIGGVPEVDLTYLMGVILAEGGAGRLAAAFNKLFDVPTPLLVTSAPMRGTDGANTTVPDSSGTAAGLHSTTDGKIDAVKGDTAAILTDTAVIGVAGVGLTDLGGMSTAMKAEINNEMLDVLNVDTYSEPGQGNPPSAPTFRQMIHYLYKRFRNKETQTSTQYSLYNDAGDIIDQKATVGSDGTTFTKDEVGTG